MSTVELSERLNRLVGWYATLSPATLPDLANYYAADARFKDPFNDVTGRPAIQRIFCHMFEQLDQPQFIVTGMYPGDTASPGEAMLRWELRFRHQALGKDEQCIAGSSLLTFDASGQVTLHRDYWDAAEELWAKLPLIGPLTRMLQRQFASR